MMNLYERLIAQKTDAVSQVSVTDSSTFVL